MDMKVLAVRGKINQSLDEFINAFEDDDLKEFACCTIRSKNSFSVTFKKSEDTDDLDDSEVLVRIKNISLVLVRKKINEAFNDCISSLKNEDFNNWKWFVSCSEDSFEFTFKRVEEQDFEVGLDIALLDGVEG